MAWMPGAIHKPIAKHNKRKRGTVNRLNLHIAVSEAASLYGFFSGAQVCSHFYVRRDGTIEQYIDTSCYSAADLEGNDATISAETQGGVTNADREEWTPQQVDALARIFRWVRETHGVANKIATSSRKGEESKGLSWHRLGVDPWRVNGGMKYSNARGKICPGSARIAQIQGIFNASQSGGGVTPVTNPIAPAPAPADPSAKGWLQRGDVGASVGELQGLLNKAGIGLAVDNSFGPDTENCVKRYQDSRGLVNDGLAGPATMASLRSGAPAKHVPPAGRNLARGSVGDDVARLQAHLKANYPLYAKKLVVDGSFGPATQAAVKEFQRRSGLSPDGSVGPLTRAALGL